MKLGLDMSLENRARGYIWNYDETYTVLVLNGRTVYNKTSCTAEIRHKT